MLSSPDSGCRNAADDRQVTTPAVDSSDRCRVGLGFRGAEWQGSVPTSTFEARIFLRTGKAKVVHRPPFTIRLSYNSPTCTQPLTQRLDGLSSVLRTAGIDQDGNRLHASELMVPNDIAECMRWRPTYHRPRCQRKRRASAPNTVSALTACSHASLPDSPPSGFPSQSTIDNVQRNVEQWFQRIPQCPTAS
jgi:hypothetical protein